MNKLALALGLLSSAVAAEYTTTLLFVGLELDSQGIGGYVGSVMGSDATATTYSVTCPAFVGEACGIPPSFTITQGPSTMNYAFPTGGGDMTAGCKITTDHGVCSGSILATGAAGGMATVSYSTFGTDAGAIPVTITAGGVAPGATPSSGSIAVTSATTTGTAAGQTGGSSTTSGGNSSSSGSSSPSGSPSSSGSSQVSTGGMPIVTAHAQWAIGGAAAALAIAAI